MSRQIYHQGLSRLGKGEIQRMGVETLQTLSTFLGSKLYLMGGDQPSEIDCVLFGFLTTILYTMPEDNVLRIVVEKRLGNLLQFTKRMKNNVYPDWDDVIGKKSLTELKKKEEEKPARPPPPIQNAQNSQKRNLRKINQKRNLRKTHLKRNLRKIHLKPNHRKINQKRNLRKTLRHLSLKMRKFHQKRQLRNHLRNLPTVNRLPRSKFKIIETFKRNHLLLLY